MRTDCFAAEKGCVLRLCVLAGERGGRAIGGSALGEKVSETLLPGFWRAHLAVCSYDTESGDQTNCNTADNARRVLVRKPAPGR